MAELKKDGIRAMMSESVERETVKGMSQRRLDVADNDAPEREFDHFSIVPFKAICGADSVGQTTSQTPERVKCAICWRYWKEWDSSRDLAAPDAAQKAAEEIVSKNLAPFTVSKIAGIISKHFPATPDAVRQARRETWLPIETAPKDGSPILIANSRTVHEVRWMISADKGAPEGGWFVGGYSGWLLTWKPTHWKPLPPVPIAAIGDDKE